MLARPEIRRHNGKKFVLFFGAQRVNGVCSNWYKSDFTVDGITFNCVEQYMMYKKAMLFGDTAVADEILKETAPKNMKAYGRKVKGFDPVTWDKEKYNIVYTGVYEKFKQNFGLNKWLEAADADYFVECSPYDAIWGIKIAADDIRAMEPNRWCGENLLGKALKEARDKLFGTE